MCPKGLLVGSFKPFETYYSQNGNLPQGSGWKSTNIWNHHLDIPRLSYKTFNSELATQLSLQLFRENLPLLTVKTQLHRGSVEISSPKESQTFNNNDFWSPLVIAESKGSDWSAQLQNMIEIIQTRSMTFRLRNAWIMWCLWDNRRVGICVAVPFINSTSMIQLKISDCQPTDCFQNLCSMWKPWI